MKRLALALLLSLGLCGVTFACPDGGPCTCDDTEPVVVEVVDIDTASTQAVDSAVYTAETADEKVNELVSTAAMAQFQLVNSVAFLKAEGVSENDLADLIDAGDSLKSALTKAQPIFIKGIVTVQYAELLRQDADGDPARLLKAAAAYCEAAVYFNAAGTALEGTTETIEDAKALAQKLFESLEPEDTDDTDVDIDTIYRD
jgi:hypothetical protein